MIITSLKETINYTFNPSLKIRVFFFLLMYYIKLEPVGKKHIYTHISSKKKKLYYRDGGCIFLSI
jgi:hypothetical protein